MELAPINPVKYAPLGLSAGEIKHGPIALIGPGVPCVFLVPADSHYRKTISNLKEIKARNAPIIAAATEANSEIKKSADDLIKIPKTLDYLYPILTVVPCQLLAYYTARFMGRNIDQTRQIWQKA